MPSRRRLCHNRRCAGAKEPREWTRVTTTTTQELPAGEASKRRDHVPLGILYMVGATLVF